MCIEILPWRHAKPLERKMQTMNVYSRFNFKPAQNFEAKTHSDNSIRMNEVKLCKGVPIDASLKKTCDSFCLKY